MKLAPMLCILVAISAPSSANDFFRDYQELELNRAGQTDIERIHRLYGLYWDHQMAMHPEQATYSGYPGHNDRWTDYSSAAIGHRKEATRWPLRVLDTIDTDMLDPVDRLNHDLLTRALLIQVQGGRFPDELMPIDPIKGIHRSASQLTNAMPTTSASDYNDILARMESFPDLIDQVIALLEIGLARQITPPRVSMAGVAAQLDGQVDVPPAEHPMMQPFARIPATIENPEQLADRARLLIRDKVIPAFGKLRSYLQDTYVPATRTAIACQSLPDGKAWYRYNVRLHTSTDLTPGEIHQIGLAAVSGIREEMDQVIAASGFDRGFDEFIDMLRNDPRFYFDEPEDLMIAYRDIAKRADPELTRLFGRLPRLTYGVIPIPDYYAKSETTARYRSGSPEAGRPGYFMANTYNLRARPKWEMEALTIHEAVPGHHLQISIAQEIPGLPQFRKHGGYTAFVEGWGLYSEKLGEEMGFYQDPYSKFGQLTYQMWRAVRLVVDTGMHSMGWSRDQAIEYFMANSSKPEHDIRVEIDRYIVWPGQALAYKIGEMKITELRGYAQSRLGDQFDIREFHDRILGQGALPLDVLDRIIREWVDTSLASASEAG